MHERKKAFCCAHSQHLIPPFHLQITHATLCCGADSGELLFLVVNFYVSPTPSHIYARGENFHIRSRDDGSSSNCGKAGGERDMGVWCEGSSRSLFILRFQGSFFFYLLHITQMGCFKVVERGKNFKFMMMTNLCGLY